jgi:hypothetical protein
MFVTHPPPLLNNVHHKDKAKSRKHMEMASEQKHQYTVNEQGEREEKKMSVNCLLNNSPSDIIHIKSNGLHSSANGMSDGKVYFEVCTLLTPRLDIARISDFHSSKDTNERPSSYDDQYIEYSMHHLHISVRKHRLTPTTFTSLSLPFNIHCYTTHFLSTR